MNLENALDPILKKSQRDQTALVEALFRRPESLSQFLPYDEFIDAEKYFRLKDGSLGVVYKVDLFEHEPMKANEIIEATDGLKSWFSLPTNCVLQLHYEQKIVSKLDSTFDTIQSYCPDPHPVSKLLLEHRIEKLKADSEAANNSAPMKRSLYLSIRYFSDQVRPGKYKKQMMMPGESILLGEVKEFSREFRNFTQLVKDFEKNSKVGLTRLGAEELLDFLRQFFNPKSYYERRFARFNPSVPISDQVIFSSPTGSYPSIEREGIKTKTLSLATSPHLAYPGGMAYFTQLPFPFRLSLNIKFPTKTQSKTFFDLKEFFLQNTPSARARRQREDVLLVQEKLAHGDRVVHATINVTVESDNEEVLSDRVRSVLNVFHNDLECEAILDDDIGFGLCLNSLPLNYIPQADYSSRRFIRILRTDLIRFIPIFDSFRGLRNPLQIYLSRENNLVPFNLFENETSNHTVVLADSGSGKSAFVIDCVQALKRIKPEPLTFVIDKKSSYAMLAEYFDGELTVFDRTKDMPFSPFRGQFDEEKIAFLTRLLISGIGFTSPSFTIQSDHSVLLAKAIKLAHERRLGQAGLTYVAGELKKGTAQSETEISMEDIVSELASLTSFPDFEIMKEQVDELLVKLRPFYGDGIYARFFNRTERRSTTGSKSFYVYDLDSLDQDPTLQALMTMAVMDEIKRIIKLPKNRGRMGVVIFEELGMLGRANPTISPYIVDYAETARKLGLWLIGLTPRPQNYFELEAGKAMWGVADNFIFLQMSSDNVEYLASKSSVLDEATKEIVKSLKTKRGEYAEVFYTNKKRTKQGAFRYFQTPFDRWLAPTNQRDSLAAIDTLAKYPNQKWAALEYLVKTHPKGT